jgi:hypothetical protein
VLLTVVVTVHTMLMPPSSWYMHRGNMQSSMCKSSTCSNVVCVQTVLQRGVYTVVHIPWCIYRGAYTVVHIPWCIYRGAYTVGRHIP